MSRSGIIYVSFCTGLLGHLQLEDSYRLSILNPLLGYLREKLSQTKIETRAQPPASVEDEGDSETGTFLKTYSTLR